MAIRKRQQTQEKDYMIFIQVYSPALIEAITLFVVTIFFEPFWQTSRMILQSFCLYFFLSCIFELIKNFFNRVIIIILNVTSFRSSCIMRSLTENVTKFLRTVSLTSCFVLGCNPSAVSELVTGIGKILRSIPPQSFSR